MNEEYIPSSMQVAKGVTENEYRKARFQSRLTWFITFSVPFAAFMYWMLVDASFFHADEAPPFKLAIGWGIVANRGLHYALKDGRKMGSLRMQKYAELRRFRISRDKLKPHG